MSRVRADLLLVEKGLSESRAKARAAIEAGGVTANGRPVEKPSELLSPDAVLEARAASAWVSRGGDKLAHALEVFRVDPKGLACLDVGASTGGFSDVLLSKGAARVVAVDVGRDQLHAKLRGDGRLISLEGRDARTLTGEDVGAPDLIVCDVSFIGAAKALATPLGLAAPHARLIALIKPQFEAGPNAAGKKGVLEEPTARAAAGAAIAGLDGLQGFAVRAFCESPIRGGDGNLEFLALAER